MTTMINGRSRARLRPDCLLDANRAENNAENNTVRWRVRKRSQARLMCPLGLDNSPADEFVHNRRGDFLGALYICLDYHVGVLRLFVGCRNARKFGNFPRQGTRIETLGVAPFEHFN